MTQNPAPKPAYGRLELLPSSTLHGLIDWALATMYPEGVDDTLTLQRTVPTHYRALALEALRFAFIAAGVAHDETVIERLDEAMPLLHDDDYGAWKGDELLHDALALVVASGRLDAAARLRFARSEDPGQRYSVALGLRAQDPAQRELLLELARDHEPEVRERARKQLEKHGEGLPFWLGHFSLDPAALLPAEPPAALRDALREYVRLLDNLDLSDAKRGPAVHACLEAMPPRLRADAAFCYLRQRDLADLQDTLWITPLLGAPELVPFFVARVEASTPLRRRGQPTTFDGAPEQTPLATRRALCDALVSALERLANTPDPSHIACDNLAVVLEAFWPRDDDPEPLLDRALDPAGAPAHDYYDPRYELARVLALPEVTLTPRVFERLGEAMLACWPERWALLRRFGDDALLRAPAATLRALAQRGLRSGLPAVIEWSISRLLFEARVPSRDGTAATVLARLLEDEGLSAVIARAEPLREYALPELRRRLRAGLLGYVDACAVVGSVNTVYGQLDAQGRGPEVKPNSARARKQKALAGFHRAPTLRGPLTAQEWTRWRAVRDPAVRARAPGWLECVSVLPYGKAWLADDALVRDAVVDLAERFGEECETQFALVARALSVYPEAALLPVWERLLARCDAELRPVYEHVYERVREALGHPKRRKVAPSPLLGDESAPDEPPGTPSADPEDAAWDLEA